MNRTEYAEAIRQAIQDERERRKYQVRVERVHVAGSIHGVHVPHGLKAYIATTVCTVAHDDGIACVWCDCAFLINGKWWVMLENDFYRNGVRMEESVKQILKELSREANTEEASVEETVKAFLKSETQYREVYRQLAEE
jgi:hypothetical protein